jgi:colanic acid/amylovoran biosynthesis glycosyltransferase
LNLVLFTATYPSSSTGEHNFLGEEIKLLAAAFERVVLVPRNVAEPFLPLPPNVETDKSYASFLNSAKNRLFAVACVLVSPLFYHELWTHLWVLIHPPTLSRLVAFLGGAHLTKRWVENWLEKNHLQASQCAFYTYWFDQGAMGVGLVRRLHPDLKFISRAHGYDLYDEIFSPPYWPCRAVAVASVDGLFADSEAGAEYLRKRHPASSSRIEASLLGVKDPGFRSFPSADRVFRILSCSHVRPVKRVDLLLEGIQCAARLRPDQKFEWHHYGTGEGQLELQQRADREFPANVRAVFHGYSTTQALMDFYRDCPIDVFVNVSRSEGTPVSSMEAISCGVPVIATAVGGNQEIAREQNGLLLPRNPSPQEIAEALFNFIDNGQANQSRREASRALWEAKYNADQNYGSFLGRLLAICGKQ